MTSRLRLILPWLMILHVANASVLKCVFKHQDLIVDIENMEKRQQFYMCDVKGGIPKDDESVTIDTANNDDANSEVKAIRFQKDKMSLIPHVMFSTFKNLEYLDMNENYLDELKNEYFKDARKLQHFWMSKSNVTELLADTFKGAHSLIVLNFAYNPIEFIHKYAFRDLTQLKELSLGNNPLMMINSESFRPIKELRFLNLNNADGKHEFCIATTFKNPDLLENVRRALEKSCHPNYVEELLERGYRAQKNVQKIEMELKELASESYFKYMNLVMIAVQILMMLIFIGATTFYIHYKIKRAFEMNHTPRQPEHSYTSFAGSLLDGYDALLKPEFRKNCAPSVQSRDTNNYVVQFNSVENKLKIVSHRPEETNQPQTGSEKATITVTNENENLKINDQPNPVADPLDDYSGEVKLRTVPVKIQS